MTLDQSSASPRSVGFATETEQLKTLEGMVIAKAGDAVVTGTKGESWPVPREAFFRKYAPVLGLVAGEDGQYTKRLTFVEARRLDAEETITLSDGRGALVGHIGDWSLTYGASNQAFIRADIFAESYQPSKSVSVCIGVESTLFATVAIDLADAEAALRAALPHTPVFFVSAKVDDILGYPHWFQVAATKMSTDAQAIDAPTVLALEDLTSHSCNATLLDHIRRLHNRTALSFTWDRLLGLLSSFFSEAREPTDAESIAAQLVAVDELNAELQKGRTSEFFVSAFPGALATAANDDLRRVGAVADLLAVESQRKWQQLVLADTKAIASLQNKDLSVNNIDRQTDLSQGDDGSSQMVESEKGVLQLFVAHEQLAESIEPPMACLHHPAARLLLRIAFLALCLALAAHYMRDIAVGQDDLHGVLSPVPETFLPAS